MLEFLETGVTVSAGSGSATKASGVSQDAAEAGAEYVDLEITNMRRIIAQRLTESKQTIPHTYGLRTFLSTEFTMHFFHWFLCILTI